MADEKINYEYANASFDLSPASFWDLFTEPSLQVLLHYSVNSYTDAAVAIRSPLAVAVLVNEQQAAAAGGAAPTSPESDPASPATGTDG